MIIRFDIFPSEDGETPYVNLFPEQIASLIQKYETNNLVCEIRETAYGHCPVYFHTKKTIKIDENGVAKLVI